MRNFYSLLIALLAVCGLAQAQTTVTFTAGTDVYPSTEAGAHSLTKDGVTIAVSNGTFGRTDNFRVYKGQTLQVSSTAGNIQKIVMVCTSTNAASNFTAIEGLTIDGNGNTLNLTGVTSISPRYGLTLKNISIASRTKTGRKLKAGRKLKTVIA